MILPHLHSQLVSKENYQLLHKTIKENTFTKYSNYEIDSSEYDPICREILKQSIDYVCQHAKETDTFPGINKSVLVHALPKSYRYVTQNAPLKSSTPQQPNPLLPLPTTTTTPPLVEAHPPTEITTTLPRYQMSSNYVPTSLPVLSSGERELLHDSSPFRFLFHLHQQRLSLTPDEIITLPKPHQEGTYEVMGILVYKRNDPSDFQLSITINEQRYDQFMLDKQRNSFFLYKPIIPVILPVATQYLISLLSPPLSLPDYSNLSSLRYEEDTKTIQFTLTRAIDIQPGHHVRVLSLYIDNDIDIDCPSGWVVTHVHSQPPSYVITVSSSHPYANTFSCQATGILINDTLQTKLFLSPL